MHSVLLHGSLNDLVSAHSSLKRNIFILLCSFRSQKLQPQKGGMLYIKDICLTGMNKGYAD